MPKKKQRFQRPHGKRRHQKIFVISAEGTKTEPRYFKMLNDPKSPTFKVECLKQKHGNSPRDVLRTMVDYLEKGTLIPPYEAWVVVDKDQWPDEQLEELHEWAEEHGNHRFALSNPKFEYWLLLHFEDGNAITSARQCTSRLKRYIPKYDKKVDTQHITQERIEKAIECAKRRDNPPCTDWPRTLGGTTVYKLVENILKAAKE